ncbi:AbrB/MazE/SpoVT family DNA-binding domain-containing protein [Micromonospora sp. WMMD1120]|uniref:AbrB/MazE/SpoVT family DNA-binding domain-containing protein n=1 Tax=Micromonospora sp. WMMD1120 TaxID=3016106 RepID=UPI00241749D2|nr:AbrB/MazE/SpoVT family DNA-binding domain-containing protein [Micromonospora sp. WMMD1120]MDG4811185.1 AbrB/MazE/SpoVT family DNA-binding domain-containing protein [Micromonospora sp. WMMD1120]
MNIKEYRGLIVVSADEQGVFKVSKDGYVRLPAVVRQWCGLAAGDRVLVVAESASNCLVVHPPAKLDEMIGQAHDAIFGGKHE